MATATQTWPTAAQVDEALQTLERGMDALNELAGGPASGYLGLVDEEGPREDGFSLGEGVPVPTYADIGLLAVFTDRLRGEVDQLQEWIEGLENAFHLARLNGLADDA